MASNHNSMKPLHDAIRDAAEKVKSHLEDRQAANDAIETVRSELQTKGIGRKAFKMASDYIEMTEDQRRSFDLAYHIVREALGAPLQPDLLDRLGTMTPDEIAEQAEDPEDDEAEA